jgi:uncharacterized membrane protein
MPVRRDYAILPWMHSPLFFSATLPGFFASFVEFVEALTIVLAVGVTRGWRAALLGVAAGALMLLVLIIGFGPALALVPFAILQLVIGVLLLLFGLRWLRKAVLRAAGVIALHDEALIFEKQRTALLSEAVPQNFDGVGFLVSFKAVVLEGLEVVFIVIALGTAAGALVAASIGAAAAGAIVVGLGFAVHRPLSRVPENGLKLFVGIMLSAFGTFWTGEALRVEWPGADWSLLALVCTYASLALLSVSLARAWRSKAIAA